MFELENIIWFNIVAFLPNIERANFFYPLSWSSLQFHFHYWVTPTSKAVGWFWCLWQANKKCVFFESATLTHWIVPREMQTLFLTLLPQLPADPNGGTGLRFGLPLSQYWKLITVGADDALRADVGRVVPACTSETRVVCWILDGNVC